MFNLTKDSHALTNSKVRILVGAVPKFTPRNMISAKDHTTLTIITNFKDEIVMI